jgi:hypothetical protein
MRVCADVAAKYMSTYCVINAGSAAATIIVSHRMMGHRRRQEGQPPRRRIPAGEGFGSARRRADLPRPSSCDKAWTASRA